MNKQEINEFFEILSALNPEPVTELKYTNAFTLLVAVILSAQSTDVGVNKATESLFKVADTPQQMLDIGEDGLKDYIKTIGLFNTKAKNIIKMSQILVEQHHGEVPRERKDLEALPGVGRKTANVVLNTIFKEPVIAVDTHIFRISNRIGLAKGKTPEEVEQALYKRIPSKWLLNAHHWLVLHGRYICVAKKPKCGICPVYALCEYKFKTV